MRSQISCETPAVGRTRISTRQINLFPKAFESFRTNAVQGRGAVRQRIVNASFKPACVIKNAELLGKFNFCEGVYCCHEFSEHRAVRR